MRGTAPLLEGSATWRIGQRAVSLKWFIVAALVVFTLRLIAISFLPDYPISLGPDEGTYAEVVTVVAAGEDWRSWGVGWGGYLYPGARAFLAPAVALTHVGIDSLTGLRLVSAFYSLVATILFVFIIAVARTPKGGILQVNIPAVSLASVSILVVIAVPSRLLWATLGLRESASEVFALAAVAAAASLLRMTFTLPLRVVLLAGLFLGVVGAFQSRTLLGVAIAFSLLVGLLISFPGAKARTSLLSLVVLCAIPAGVTASAGQLPVVMDTGLQTSSEIPDGPSMQESIRSGAGILNPGSLVSRSSSQREASAIAADSAITVVVCSPGNFLSLLRCELSRLPSALPLVLFRPLPILDGWSELPSSRKMAALENVAWVLLFLVAGACLLFSNSRMRFVTVVCFTYGSIIIAGLALLEGNLGTAFRHKGQLVWPLCLVLATAGAWRFSRTRKPGAQQNANLTDSRGAAD